MEKKQKGLVRVGSFSLFGLFFRKKLQKILHSLYSKKKNGFYMYYFFFLFLTFFFLPVEGFPTKKENLFQGIIVYEGERPSLTKGEGIFCFVSSEKKETENLERTLGSYLQRPINRENLGRIKQEIAHIFSKYPELVVVEIPEQKIEKGVVSFRLLCAKVGKVSYTGNYWMPLWQYTRYLSVKEGELIQKKTLLNNAAWVNLNPFRHVDVIFSPGARKGLTDIEFAIRDRFPISPSLGMDNTGNSYTGNHRIYTGFQWGNAFGTGDLLSYQFTVSNEYKRFFSHFASFHGYLPWKHIFQLYGAYSRSRPEGEGFYSDGKSSQISLRYQIPFSPFYTDFSQQFSLGFDYKSMNTSIFFTSQENQSAPQRKAADLTQVVLEYELQKSFSNQRVFFKTEVFGSPCKITQGQKSLLYSLIRAGAKPLYFYGKAQASYVYDFYPHFSLYVDARTQVSNRTLLPSEAFGLGGYGTVRGYTERVFIADKALLANIELRHTHTFGSSWFSNELTSYLFMDTGWGRNYRRVEGLHKKKDYLWSVGPGVKWKIAPYFQARIDYGFQLHTFEEKELGKIHFGLTAQW